MKKNLLFLLSALSAIILSSCTNGSSGKVSTLTNEADSFAYAWGVRMSEGFVFNAVNRIGVDSTCINEMMKGFEEAFYGCDDPKKKAYYVGTQYGTTLKEQVVAGIEERMKADGDSSEINQDILFQGFRAGVSQEDLLIDPTTSMLYVTSTEHMRHERYMEKKYASNILVSKEFMEENGKQPGITTTASGLQYRVDRMGNGPKPVKGDRVKVNYSGKLINGDVFDSSYERGKPSEFSLNTVIKGWEEGLQLMPVGSKFTFYVPYDLAYGSRDQAKIRPYSALIFEVELLDILKK